MPFPQKVFFVQTYTTNINIRNIFPDLSDRRAVEFDFSRKACVIRMEKSIGNVHYVREKICHLRRFISLIMGIDIIAPRHALG